MKRRNDTFRQRYKAFRKHLLSKTPLIRRVRHERVIARFRRHLDHERSTNEAMGRLFFAPPPLANRAKYAVPVSVRQGSTRELCLFVTHISTRGLKAHVVDHIESLLEAGVDVCLIANIDSDPSEFSLPVDLGRRLFGCIARENIGFDFAAWGHAYTLIDRDRSTERVFLINDSILGPLDNEAYRELLRKIRTSNADLIGLTANPDPHPHLQSYYLVVNKRLLHSDSFDTFMRNIVNMPLKQNVIDCYEIWMSPFFEAQGFTCSSIFPNLSTEPPPRRNDTLCAWRELLEIGFPFVKSMVVKDPIEGPDARRVVPGRYLEDGGLS